MRRLILALALCATAAVAAPQIALALGPAESPQVLVTEGFEYSSTQTPVNYTTAPTGTGASWGYWDEITKVKRSGSYALWCDGTRTIRLTRTPFVYEEGSAGFATFAIPQTADYYKPVVSFYYTLPSRGDDDELAFAPQWTSNAQEPLSWASAAGSMNLAAGWVKHDIDLTAFYQGQTGESLSRQPGKFRFMWRDVLEIDPLEGDPKIHFGQGPSVDDLTIAGWKFGPVRELAAATTAGSTTLTWARPYRSTLETVVEERNLSFRVWRAPMSAPTEWTELTSSPRAAEPGTTFTFVDTTPASATAYKYAVQAWEPGSGETGGYGQHVVVEATTKAAPSLQVRITGPAANSPDTAFGIQPINVTGIAGSSGSDSPLASVRVTIAARRAPLPPRYWNGIGWQAAETSVTPLGLGLWSTAFKPVFGDDHRIAYTITAKATDTAGQSVNAAQLVVYADTVYPRITSARSLGRYGIELRFSERPYAASTNVPLSAIKTPYFSVRGLRLGRGVWSSDGTIVRYSTSRQSSPGGRVSVVTLRRYQDRAGNLTP